MSNYAALIDVLSVSGSRLSDGTANASGKVWFFQPGGNTPVNVYSDAEASAIVTQPVTLTAGGLLNRTNFPNGIFATQPVRLYIETSGGTVVSDTIYVPATAGNVGVNNAGFTDSTLDAVLTDALTSFGGDDWTYLESGGATPRTIHDKFQEQGIWVTDFPDVDPTGTGVSTTGVQSALNRAKALSCPLNFPDGTFKIDQALTLSSATGVAIRGAGVAATRIVTTNTAANVFTLSSCTSCTFENLGITASATNSASAISLSGCTDTQLRNVLVNAAGGGTFLIPVVTASATVTLIIEDCVLTAKAADATARALKMTDTTTVYIRGGTFSGFTGAAMEFAGATAKVSVIASAFGNVSANIGILWTAAMTGLDFTVVGCPTLRSAAGTVTTPFDLSALTTNPRFRQWGNEVDGYATTVTSGGTFTPDLSRGNYIRVVGTTTGAAYTVALPIPAPSTLMQGYMMVLDFHNGAGGAITGWTLNAGYHMSAVSTTDTEHTVYHLWWDTTSSVWRQIARSVST